MTQYSIFATVIALVLACTTLGSAAEPARYLSHPPVRPLPRASDRPLPVAPTHFVDSIKGDDAAPGTREKPWRTLGHGLSKVKPGETLVLRGGTFYEHATVRLAGTADKPVTIRGFPGELAILDGGLREFFENPAEAWEPCADGAAGEFQSKRVFPDLAKETGDGPAVFGNFGDSWLPLQAYRFHGDLRSDNPFWNVEKKVGGESFVYCGPGLCFSPETERIHCRLTPTKLSGLGDDNYRGENDPRKLSLVVAGGEEPPLKLVGCQHVRLLDLVLRGSRVPTLQIHECRNIELDGLSVYGGSSAVQVLDTAGLRMQHTACRGVGAPWTFRGSLKYRSVEARIFSASRWEQSGVDNRDFEIRHSEFTDSVDGVFLGNVRGVRFHHNLVENVTDDGLFLTAATAYDGATHGGDVEIYQNRLARILTTFAFGVGHGRQRAIETGRQTGSGVRIYRNVFDLRRPVWYHWPAGPDEPQEITTRGRFAGDHGSPAWEPMRIYHNTLLAGGTPRYDYGSDGLIHGIAKGTSRRVFNNLVCLTEGTPGATLPPAEADFQGDGNLFWSLAPPTELPEDLFAKFRAGVVFEQSKRAYPSGWTAHDQVADPRVERLAADWRETADLRPGKGSPLIDSGVDLPRDWPDTLRAADAGRPDIGAIPLGLSAWRVGVFGRFDACGNSASAHSVAESKWHYPLAPSPAMKLPKALIVEGYPAFDAPIIAYLLRKDGWQVEVVERAWADAGKLAGYQLVVYDGSLARAKVEKTKYDAADLAHVDSFLKSGGTLLLTRERTDLFGADEGRKFLEEIVGPGLRETIPAVRVRQADHPWLKSLAGAEELPWLTKGTALRTSKGESLLGSDRGASILHRAPLGKGHLIYVGWSPAASIPHGRLPATPAQETAFEAQVAVLRSALASARTKLDRN